MADVKYEWRDETGMGHPTLVVVDTTGKDVPQIEELDKLPVLRTKQIWDFPSVLQFGKNGRVKQNRLPRIKGYEYVWYDVHRGRDYYALYVGYRKVE